MFLKIIFLLTLLAHSALWAHSGGEGKQNNDLLDGGFKQISFRLLIDGKPDSCLYQVQLEDRIVVQQSKNCSDSASIFRYSDGGDHKAFLLSNDTYLLYVIKPSLPKTSATKWLPENLIPGNATTQEEFVNGMAVDLFEQNDGTFVLADHDEEGSYSQTMCVSATNSQDKSQLGSVELIKMESNKTSKCARLSLQVIEKNR